jgi:hypothetical protein
MKKLFAAFLASVPFLSAQHPNAEAVRDSSTWQSGKTEYQGFPLILRRQTGLDYGALPPKLVVITHLLDKTKPNGLPEPDYNETLFDFDEDVIRSFRERKAVVVLVETFGHKRAYYAYCPEQVSSVDMKDQLSTRYAKVRLECFERSDSTGIFIKKYAKEHF